MLRQTSWHLQPKHLPTANQHRKRARYRSPGIGSTLVNRPHVNLIWIAQKLRCGAHALFRGTRYRIERNITAVVDQPANAAAPIHAHSATSPTNKTRPNTVLEDAWKWVITFLCSEYIENAKLTPMKEATIRDTMYRPIPPPAALAACNAVLNGTTRHAPAKISHIVILVTPTPTCCSRAGGCSRNSRCAKVRPFGERCPKCSEESWSAAGGC